MRHAAMLALLAPLSAFAAGEGLVTGPQVVSMLEQAGYTAELDQDGVGDPLVITHARGLDYFIYFHECDQGRCEALQFRVGLDLVDGATAGVVNEFNRNHRFARSFRDEEDDPFLVMDVEMTHADHPAQFATHLSIWEALLDAFSGAMGFGGGGDDWEEKRIAWSVAPQPGQPLLYDASHASVSAQGGERMEIRTSGLTRIVAENDGDGLLQRWTSSGTLVEVEGAPPGLESVLVSAVTAFDGIELAVRLDEEGNYAAVANLDQIQPVYRDAMLGMFDGVGAALGGGGMPAELEAMLDTMSAPEVLEVQLAELPVAYNFPAGGGLQLDREYAYRDEGSNPFGSDPIPTDNTMLLTESAEVPGHYELVWTLTPEPEAAWVAVTAAARQLTAGMVEDEEGAREALDQAIAALGDGAHFSTVVTYRIDPHTGVVQHMEHVATKRFGGKEEVETSVLSLRTP